MSHHGRKIVEIKLDENAGAIHRSHPYVEEIARTEASRPVSAGTGKHRGDRRDMSPTYTNNDRHAAHGNMPRKDVKTRKR